MGTLRDIAEQLLKLVELNFDTMFLQVLDLSVAGAIVIAAVIAVRFLLRKAPIICSYVLWLVVLVRLLCPVLPTAPWALIAESNIGEDYGLAQEDISFDGALGAAYEAIGDAVNGGLGIQYIMTEHVDEEGRREVVTSDWYDVWILFGKYVWAAGVFVILIRAFSSYWKLRKVIRLSVPLQEKHWSNAVVAEKKPTVFLADGIKTAFVTGLVYPKIFLPSELPERDRLFILAHERCHIRRGDQIWKLLAFVAVCIHWFNPFVWVAFRLACNDMEMSCDEAVLSKLGHDIRRDYSALLLRLSTGNHRVNTSLTFGEGDTRDRIVHVMKYRKNAAWITAIAMVPVLMIVSFLSVSKSSVQTMVEPYAYTANVLYRASASSDAKLDMEPSLYCVTPDQKLYLKYYEEEPWTLAGKLEHYPLSKSELMQYAAWDKGWVRSYRMKEVTDAHILRKDNGMFYLIFRTKNGDSFAGYGWEDLGERGQGASDDTSLRYLHKLKQYPSFDLVSGLTLTAVLNGPYLPLQTETVDSYYLVAYRCGEQYQDLGYAIFEEENGVYLKENHVYENAALAKDGVFFCPDPAVLSKDGKMNERSTYDVLLNVNPEMDRIEQIIKKGEAEVRTLETNELNGCGMLLLNWNDRAMSEACSLTIHVYDSEGNMLTYDAAAE